MSDDELRAWVPFVGVIVAAFGGLLFLWLH